MGGFLVSMEVKFKRETSLDYPNLLSQHVDFL